MRAHYLQHVPFEGLVAIEPWLSARGFEITGTSLYETSRLPGLDDFDWLIIMGGPMSVHDESDHPWLGSEKRLIADAVAASKVVLGVCLGAQLIAAALGAKVVPNPEREIGWFPIAPVPGPPTPFAAIVAGPLDVFHWHGQTFDLPRGAVHLARSAACEHQAFWIPPRVLGLQFHLEVTGRSVSRLVDACPADLRPGPFVQSPGEMLRDPTRFARINDVLATTLDHLGRIPA
jgi:GMP synthase-like glutamine amidotransferase